MKPDETNDDEALALGALGWTLSDPDLERDLNIPNVALINDMVAHGENIARLREDRALTAALADNGTRDVTAFTHEAWAAGFHSALRQITDC